MNPITKPRSLVNDGGLPVSGSASPQGFMPRYITRFDQPDWNPTAETLRKLKANSFANNDDTPALVPTKRSSRRPATADVYSVDDEDRENEGDLIIPSVR
jgi:3,4-dihydroxy 2-butanone 4-phosphate synthase/GTP cyclohydrolase II